MVIHGISALHDNYIWAMHLTKNNACAIVDPGEAAPVIRFLKQHQLTLTYILITHHHYDHTDGVPALLRAFPDAIVYGPDNPSLNFINQRVKAQDVVTLPQLDLSFEVIAVAGHTLDHIAFFCAKLSSVFCGDTLFSIGCGRLFEGTPEMLFQALEKLKALPDNTQVFCAHEYTLKNIEFARHINPKNKALSAYQAQCQACIAAGKPTLPSTIATEKALNPFLRCDQEAERAFAQRQGATDLTPLNVFTVLRQAKDRF